MTTTHNTTNIEFEYRNSTEVLSVRNTHHQGYSFGTTTIILQTKNESIKAKNWINGVNESIQGLNELKKYIKKYLRGGIWNDTMLKEQGT